MQSLIGENFDPDLHRTRLIDFKLSRIIQGDSSQRSTNGIIGGHLYYNSETLEGLMSCIDISEIGNETDKNDFSSGQCSSFFKAGGSNGDVKVHINQSSSSSEPFFTDKERREVLGRARSALSMDVIEQHNEALVRCWDLGGQKEYLMVHSPFIQFANIILLVVHLEKLSDETT